MIDLTGFEHLKDYYQYILQVLPQENGIRVRFLKTPETLKFCLEDSWKLNFGQSLTYLTIEYDGIQSCYRGLFYSNIKVIGNKRRSYIEVTYIASEWRHEKLNSLY